MSPYFAETAEAITNPEPFALVSLRDLMQSSPEFLLSLTAIELFRSPNAGAIPPELECVIEDLDEQVNFTTEMVRAGLATIARLMSDKAEDRSVGRKEVLEAACQKFTQDSVRLSTLLILRDTLTVPAEQIAPTTAINS
ncbi:hypothetical protein [Sinorhizobium americanum]|uniref:Resolvase, N-terminal n=1 Tax=Sinorhizobium americanum TaxID=194963 RepID=A0A1L3LPA4_9HYPH|nr:hypothetical protein [Sinorhizobium americanum]APG91866.1 resolvase, N-terminal [Sinorhizobium americanum]OAP47440.1 hypothetical protein ATC00_22550 [Sinorhizobium americanum]